MGQAGESLLEQAARIHRTLSLTPYPPFSEREMLQRVLHLANDPRDLTDEQKAEAMFATMLSHGFPSKTMAQYARLMKQTDKSFFRNAWAGIEPERAQFRYQVEEVFRNRDDARKKLEAKVAAAFGDVVLVPMVSVKSWIISYELRYFALNTRGACAFALALLLDESKGFGAALKKCRLSECPNFFLSLPAESGGRPPLYCSTAHQMERSNQDSAERKRRQRDKAKARKAK